MTTKLKPCPFCGGNAHRSIIYMEVSYGYSVMCESCGIATQTEFEEDAVIEAWNRRVDEDGNGKD